jgi:preprotein translocase subunit SecF
MQFFSKANINFIGNRKIGYFISGTLILIGLVALILRGGPNYGVDFRGGVSIRVQFDEDVPIEDVRASLDKIGYGNAEIKKSITEQSETVLEEFIIRVAATEGETGTRVVDQLQNDFGEEHVVVRSIESVGPKIGGELRRAAIYAILLSMLFILIYISWRFEFRFAVGAIIPLFHDVLITLGVFAILNLEISLAVVAAFLTIVGYSLNDTIVVFDRIRENLKVYRREKYETVINRSINETLSRTVITSLTTLFVVVILYFFGGDVIHNFAFALMIGVIVGTYSSIFVASPILVEWQHWQERRGKVPARNRRR